MNAEFMPNTSISLLTAAIASPASNSATAISRFQTIPEQPYGSNVMSTGHVRIANRGAVVGTPASCNPCYVMPHGTKRKQNADPNRPKRPTSAYFYFVQLEREAAAKRGERISKVAEWIKQTSVKWRSLSEVEKSRFQAMAADDKARYSQEMAVYTGKDANKPKRPQSSYFLWLADFRTKMKDKILEHKDILRAAGEEWRKLSLEEKAPYEQMAEEERKKYEARMKEYQETIKKAKSTNDLGVPCVVATPSSQSDRIPLQSATSCQQFMTSSSQREQNRVECIRDTTDDEDEGEDDDGFEDDE